MSIIPNILSRRVACIDQQRLHFIRTQQKRLRVALLNGMEDALTMNDSQADLNHIGQRIILPSSYLGGPRDMHQRCLVQLGWSGNSTTFQNDRHLFDDGC
jgi:hypothetical protein